MARTRFLYLLHFERPYKHARHYLGSTDDLPARLAEHAAGRGSRLVAVVSEAGIPWRVARAWRVTGRRGREVERQLKQHGGMTRYCPCCTPDTRRGRLPGTRNLRLDALDICLQVSYPLVPLTPSP